MYSYFEIPGIAREKTSQMIFLYYLVGIGSPEYVYAVPGYGQSGNSSYRTEYYYLLESDDTYSAQFSIVKKDGPGEAYGQIRIVAIETSPAARLKLPDIDYTNYEEVSTYYGFN